jgi:hypothetical protein
VVDAEEARTATHQDVLLILAQTFNSERAVLFCEPSVVGGRSGAPFSTLPPVFTSSR